MGITFENNRHGIGKIHEEAFDKALNINRKIERELGPDTQEISDTFELEQGNENPIDSIIATGANSCIFAVKAKRITKVKDTTETTTYGLALRVWQEGDWNSLVSFSDGILDARYVYSRERIPSYGIGHYSEYQHGFLRNGDIPPLMNCSVFDKGHCQFDYKATKDIIDYLSAYTHRGAGDLRSIKTCDSLDDALLVGCSALIAWFRLKLATPGINHLDLHPGNMIVTMVPPDLLGIEGSPHERIPWVRIIDFETASFDRDVRHGEWNKILTKARNRLENDLDCTCMNALYSVLVGYGSSEARFKELMSFSLSPKGDEFWLFDWAIYKELKKVSLDRDLAGMSMSSPQERDRCIRFIDLAYTLLITRRASKTVMMDVLDLYVEIAKGDCGRESKDEYTPVEYHRRLIDNSRDDDRDIIFSAVLIPAFVSIYVEYWHISHGAVPVLLISLAGLSLVAFFMLPEKWRSEPLNAEYLTPNIFIIAVLTTSLCVDIGKMPEKQYLYIIVFITSLIAYPLYAIANRFTNGFINRVLALPLMLWNKHSILVSIAVIGLSYQIADEYYGSTGGVIMGLSIMGSGIGHNLYINKGRVIDNGNLGFLDLAATSVLIISTIAIADMMMPFILVMVILAPIACTWALIIYRPRGKGTLLNWDSGIPAIDKCVKFIWSVCRYVENKSQQRKNEPRDWL